MNGKRGYTLIEIIIALTILAIGLISILSFLPVALNSSKKSADLTKAALTAQAIFEEIKATSYSDITLADNFDTGSYNDSAQFPGIISYKVEVSPKGVAQIKDINIIVRWKRGGKYLSETFKTRIVKYNPT